MTLWHNEWQQNFPEQYQEVILHDGSVTHRADVALNNMIIEFQGSPISTEELQQRVDFYSRRNPGICV